MEYNYNFGLKIHFYIDNSRHDKSIRTISSVPFFSARRLLKIIPLRPSLTSNKEATRLETSMLKIGPQKSPELLFSTYEEINAVTSKSNTSSC